MRLPPNPSHPEAVLLSIERFSVSWRWAIVDKTQNSPLSFATPDQFLEYLRTAYGRPAALGTPDVEMIERTRADLRDANPDAPFTPEGLRDMKLVGERLKSEVYGSLAPDIAARVLPNVVLGVLDTGEANAAIYKSHDAKYAILLNTGLLLLLNKFAKLIVAWQDTSVVAYCNRKPAAELTLDELQSYLPELVATYKQYGAPYGALLKLNPSAIGRQSTLLHLSELFVVCHELGHFLNGDLENEELFCAVDGKPELRRFEENRDHAIEYAADATGFALLQDVLKPTTEGFRPEYGLLGIINLFNLFYLLTEGESLSHPNPRARTVRLARHFFGDTFAKTLEDSFADPQLLRSLFPLPDRPA
jgi:hypothetical protein